MEIYDYVVPVYYLPAMINADTSGLLDHEIEEIERFEKRLIERHGNANIMLGAESDESWFSWTNSVNNLGGDVCKVYVIDSNKQQST